MDMDANSSPVEIQRRLNTLLNDHGSVSAVLQHLNVPSNVAANFEIAAPTPPADTSTPPADTSTPPADTSTPPADTSTPPADTSTPPADTSTPPADPSTDTSSQQPPPQPDFRAPTSDETTQYNESKPTNDQWERRDVGNTFDVEVDGTTLRWKRTEIGWELDQIKPAVPQTTAANLPPRVPVIGAPGFPAPPSSPGYQTPTIMAGYDPLINKYGIKPI